MNTKVKVALAQLCVTAGHPDVNIRKILLEIKKAKTRHIDVILFSEMVVSGYLLADEWENAGLINDLMGYNEDIREASKGITVVWGNVFADADKIGEDGRIRKYNAAFVAQDGRWVSNGVFTGHTFKTLLPKYREFDDERHFFSLLKLAHEYKKDLTEVLQPFPIKINGQLIRLGCLMCEDMWCEDYSVNPTHILVENGADIIVNLSASPWTWRKNDKRHRVVKSLLEKDPIPFLYCNNIGVQNNGKNIFLFDGSSTAYNPDGTLMAVAKDYREEVLDVTIDGRNSITVAATPLSDKQDLQELYNGLIFGLSHFFDSLSNKKVVIGLSGGIDSAVSACLLTSALGPENIYGVNLPSKFNSELTKGAAAQLAKNLGISYSIFPIQPSVDLTIKELKENLIPVSSAAIENIQARDRSSRVLAALAGCLEGVFVNNGNKTETALGYCTLYGDVDGAIAPLGDLYKNEIYSLARFINEKAGKELIPASILDVVPSAELSADQDVTKGKGDPILYPYHDKLLRSFIEFRFDPEHILELYLAGTLESELKIELGLVRKYFPSNRDFINDLENKWGLYKKNIFKRIQAPPIIAVSRRAFGFDLRESQNGVYLTRGYEHLKHKILSTG